MTKKIDLKSVKLGSDAEVFLIDLTGRPFPACGLIGGTKEKPRQLTKDGVAVQEDNVMLEFNTGIAGDLTTWVKNLERAMDLSFAEIPPSLKPAIVGSMHFDPMLLDIPQAQTFGCEPDFNAWTGQQNPRPVPEDPTLRTAAAHVHISWDNPENLEQRMRVIQFADVFVSLPSLVESADRERRKLYGKAGAFRPKKYGVEHRVLDNYWLSEREYLGRIFRRYQKALEAANSDYQISPKLADRIQETINNYEVDRVDALVNEVGEGVWGSSSGDSGKKHKMGYSASLESIYRNAFQQAVVNGGTQTIGNNF